MTGLQLHFLIAFKSGLRSHGVRLILIFGAFLMFAAFLAAAFSLRQPLIVAMDVGVSGIRITALLLMLFWVQDLFCRDVENKSVLFVLAYPVPRWHYVLGRYVGILALGALALLIQGGLLKGVVALSGWGYGDSSTPQGGWAYIVTLAGVYLDISLVTAVAVLFATLAETPMLPVAAAFSFALACRGLGGILEYLHYSPNASTEQITGYLPWLEMLQWILPDLGRVDWRAAVLYGVWPSMNSLAWSCVMVLSYSLVSLGLAVHFFSRRQFQ